MDENQISVKSLIRQLIPKISEYFSKNIKLEKNLFKQFLEFIKFPLDFKEKNDLEQAWKEISKDSNTGELSKILLLRNLTEYIHNHNKDLRYEKILSEDKEPNFSGPNKIIKDIDTDNELMFELYRLLATITISDEKTLTLLSLENALNENKFINLTKDSIEELIFELLKEKSNNIEKYDYIELMEKMEKEYQYRLEKISQKKIIFENEDLDEPEHNNFIFLPDFINILLKLSDAILLSYEKNIKAIKDNDLINEEFLNRNFFILINNMRLYIYEIMRVYYEQKQKFDYFLCSNISKITLLKQESKELAEQLKIQSNDDSEMRDLYDEINMEKAKNNGLFKENLNLKQEISKNKDIFYEYEDKIKKLDKVLKEKEGKINMLNKEKDIQKEKFKNVYDQLNSMILLNKEKEIKLKELVEKMDLNNNLLFLINMDKADIISLINDKYSNIISIKNTNKLLKNKIMDLEIILKKNSEELDELKFKNDILYKNNINLQKEIEDSKKGIQESPEKSIFLNNIIDDKVDKEDYNYLESQLNEEKEKNIMLKQNINKLNEELAKIKNDNIKSIDSINLHKNIIKENHNKIGYLNEKLNKSNQKYHELLTKYKNSAVKIKEDEKKINLAIKNLNLNEKYQQLAHMEKPELIKLVINKDDYISKIENQNSHGKKEIINLKNTINELNDNIKLLNKKLISLEYELNQMKDENKILQKNLENRNKKSKLEKNYKIYKRNVNDTNELKTKMKQVTKAFINENNENLNNEYSNLMISSKEQIVSLINKKSKNAKNISYPDSELNKTIDIIIYNKMKVEEDNNDNLKIMKDENKDISNVKSKNNNKEIEINKKEESKSNWIEKIFKFKIKKINTTKKRLYKNDIINRTFELKTQK